jgi:hypothetical protein
MLRMKIVPMKTGNYYDQCILYFKGEIKGADWYPGALVHVDNFVEVQGRDNPIYNLLTKGETVEVEIKLEEDKEGE